MLGVLVTRASGDCLTLHTPAEIATGPDVISMTQRASRFHRIYLPAARHFAGYPDSEKPT
jgi:hypothetical protein